MFRAHVLIVRRAKLYYTVSGIITSWLILINKHSKCLQQMVTTCSLLQISQNVCRHTFLDCVWNVMAHAQKPDFVFRRNGRVHLNRPGSVSSVDCWQPEVCASAVVMLDTPCSEVVWRVLATYCIRQFPLHFCSRASPCAITFQLDCTTLQVATHYFPEQN